MNTEYVHTPLRYGVAPLISSRSVTRKKKTPTRRSASGAEGARTPDLLTASQVLSQLSYCPMSCEAVPKIGEEDEAVKAILKACGDASGVGM